MHTKTKSHNNQLPKISKDHNTNRQQPGTKNRQQGYNQTDMYYPYIASRMSKAYRHAEIGLFYFIGEDLQTVMRQIAHWYNIRVEYKGSEQKADCSDQQIMSLQDIIKCCAKNGLQCELSARDN